ncbi:MAG TPA: hypothetical protein VHW23_31565 [Kofleriaceae bacterium]|jgi:hypothetical protein|nr:hypothetical protein [Kofleriaceae bacterium]
MAKPPDRSVKAPAETSRVTTAKPAGKEVRRKNKRNAVAPPPTTVELPLTAAEPPPPEAVEPPPDAIEPSPEAVEPSPMRIEPPHDAVEAPSILAESLPSNGIEPSPGAAEPSPMLVDSTLLDAVEASPMLVESMPHDAGEPPPTLAESTPPDAVEPPRMLAESTPPDAAEPPRAGVADSPAVTEHAHEVLVRLSDEEHQALAAACAALAAIGQPVSIEDMIRTLIERWMAATQTATAPDVPAPAHPRLLDAVRAQLRWLVAQPLRRWHELRLALRRWTRALAT